MKKFVSFLLLGVLLIPLILAAGCSKPKTEYRLSMAVSQDYIGGATPRDLTKENNVYDYGEVILPNINFLVHFNVSYYIDGKSQGPEQIFNPENKLRDNYIGLKSYKLEDKDGNYIKDLPDKDIMRRMDTDYYYYQIKSVGKHTFEFRFPEMPELGIEETLFYVICNVLEEDKEDGAIMIIDPTSDYADYTVIEGINGQYDMYILNKYNGRIHSFPDFTICEKNDENIYNYNDYIINLYNINAINNPGEGRLILACKKMDENFEYNQWIILPESKGVYLCYLHFLDSSQYKSILKIFYVVIK